MTLDPEFVQTIHDWIKWYNYNAKDALNAGVENKLAFLEKAVRGNYIVMVALADELARVAGQSKDAPKLVMPVGVRFG